MAEFAELVRAHLLEALEPDERLQGVIAATHQRTFSGGLYAIGVTERRLLLQPLDRRMQPKGGLRAIGRDSLRSAELEGAGGGWWTVPAAVLDASALALTIRTIDGEKLKLAMMNATGLLGGLGGGQAQRDGLLALAEWMQRNAGGSPAG